MFSLPEHRTTWAAYAFLMLLVTIIAFENLTTHDFWDGWDDWDIAADLAIMADNPAHMISSQKFFEEVRPPVDLVLLAGYLIWQDNPVGFHILHIGLHLMASLLLAYTLRRHGLDLELSFLSGLLFLINTAHFRALHWITITNYVLALIFSLMLLIFYTRFLDTQKKSNLALSILLLALAIFSHPSAVSITPFCIYLTWRRTNRVGQTLFASLPLALATPILIFLAFTASPGAPQNEGAFVVPDLLRLPKNLFWYLGRLITTACWITRGTVSNQAYPLEIVLGVVAVVATLILYRNRIFPVADWAVWMVLAILPFLNNSIIRLAFGPSRQLYFASIGASVLTAWALRTGVHQFKSRLSSTTIRLVFICMLTGFVATSIFSLKRAEALSIYYAARGYAFRADNPDYHARAVQLFERSLNHAPDVVPLDLYTRLCQAGLASGKTYISYLQTALDQFPDHALLNMLMGISLFVEDDLKRHKQGEIYIQKALENAPNKDQLRQDIAVAYQNFAVYFNKQNDLVRATYLYLKALEFYPQYPLVLYSLGHIFRDQKQYDQAIEAFRKVLQINPQHKEALRLLADVLYRQGHAEEAIQTYKKFEALQ